MTKTLKNQEVVGLYSLLKATAQSTLPIKFTIARNLKAVEPVFESYQEEKDTLHKKYVLLNEQGEGVVKEEYVEVIKNMRAIPYEFFEYQDETSRTTFFDELKELGDKEVSIELTQEDLKRKVKVKLGGDAERYETLTIEEVLEDPSTPVNGDALAVLLKYGILK